MSCCANAVAASSLTDDERHQRVNHRLFVGSIVNDVQQRVDVSMMRPRSSSRGHCRAPHCGKYSALADHVSSRAVAPRQRSRSGA
jgi:hypothetical protein